LQQQQLEVDAMKIQKIANQAQALWPDIETTVVESSMTAGFRCKSEKVPELCDWLFNQQNYHFAGLVVEENSMWELHYLFVGQGEMGNIRVSTALSLQESKFQSVALKVHGADWHEREAEDLFELIFEGHPRLGDFILHDDVWQEGVAPMRKGFDPASAISNRKPRNDWRPRRIVKMPGTFIMPIGPVFSGHAESVHFQLESIGEEILRAFPRLFFKYRSVEKIAEGRSIDNGLLLAERFSGSTAFSHALAFCMAVEQLSGVKIPERALVLRCFFAELERLRVHLGVIEGICNSTGLVVAASQTAILEEKALRLAGYLADHRYLFGLSIPGGLSRDFENKTLQEAITSAREIVKDLDEIENLLTDTSTFLDRIEEVGIIRKEQSHDYGLVGPVARGSGYCNDLRKIQPYAAYNSFMFDIPCESEGDGYARLRVLFSEARQSLRIMEQAVADLPDGPIFVKSKASAGVGLAGVETPRGAAWHWVRLDEDGKIKRYRLITPSFANWHGFHLAAENFAFQDFPIILATFGLSVAENDR